MHRPKRTFRTSGATPSEQHLGSDFPARRCASDGFAIAQSRFVSSAEGHLHRPTVSSSRVLVPKNLDRIDPSRPPRGEQGRKTADRKNRDDHQGVGQCVVRRHIEKKLLQAT